MPARSSHHLTLCSEEADATIPFILSCCQSCQNQWLKKEEIEKEAVESQSEMVPRC